MIRRINNRVLAEPPFKLTIPATLDSDDKQCSNPDIIIGAKKNNSADFDINRINKIDATLSNTETAQHYSFKFVSKVATARLARSIHSTAFHLVSLFIVDSQIDDVTLKLIFSSTRYTCI